MKKNYLKTTLLLVALLVNSAFADIKAQGKIPQESLEQFTTIVNGIRKKSDKIHENDYSFYNQFEMYEELIIYIDNKHSDCLDTITDEEEGKCYRKHIKKYTKWAYKKDLIGKIITKKLNESTKQLHRKEGKNVFFDAKELKKSDKELIKQAKLQEKFADEIKEDPNFLQKRKNNIFKRIKNKLFPKKEASKYAKTSLGEYLKLKNRLRFQRYQNNPNESLDSKLEKAFRKLYFRKSRDIGKITPTEYVTLTYNPREIKRMAELIELTSKMITAKAGELVLTHYNYSDIFAQIAVIEKEIGDMILEMAKEEEHEKRLVIFEKIQKKKDDVYALEKEVHFIDIKRQIEDLEKLKEEKVATLATDIEKTKRSVILKEIKGIDITVNQLHQNIAEQTIKIPLTDKDIYNFSISYLHAILKEETINKTFSQTPSFGDVVVASYLTGTFNNETLHEIINMPELHENRVGFWKRVGQISLSIVRIVGMSNPVVGPYVTLGFVIFDSIQNKKRMEKGMADETSIIRNPFN